jgi:hypothetical protein
MIRIFLVLASLDGLALCASVVLGTLSKLRGAQFNEQDQMWMYHFYCGLGSSMLNLLVHCLIFTYFLGTGRWVKEVALAYRLPDEPYPKLTRELKRRTFPPALFGMLIAIGTVAAGAGAQLRAWHWTIHASLAAATLIINAWAFVVEGRNVRTNAMVIEKVREQAESVRREQGLPTSEEALARDGH